MDLENVQVTTAIISTIAACVSVFFAVRSQKVQEKIIKNKSALEIVHDLISQLQVARAMHQHALEFPDGEFETGIDLSDVPSKIAKLIQHDQISEKIRISEWGLPIKNLPDKISLLIKIRDNLL